MHEPDEPVAIVGMGCRLPGSVDSPESFWRLLIGGGRSTTPVPEERWRTYEDRGPGFVAALRRTTRHGSFLDDIEGFDAEFFGLSAREAGR